MITRRGFLGTTIAGAGLGALAPELLARTARAQDATTSTDAGSERVLVLLQLSGGNDGLNTVVPYADDVYRKARPKLAIDTKDVLALDSYTGLHPSMKKLRARFDAGEVAIVQAVGYPRPNRSHFRSMAIWHAADPEEGARRTGWLGRAIDVMDARGDDCGVAVSLANPLPFALQRASTPVLAFESEDNLSIAADKRFQGGKSAQVEAFRRMCAAENVGGTRSYADVVRATAASGLSTADALLGCLHSGRNQVDYPRGVGAKLAQIARLIDGGQRSRVYYATASGYDTHARQRDAHAGLLAALSDGIDAFYADLAKQGRERKVAIVVFSEFGRRLAENGSQGTDHGTCAPMLVIGPGVKGGLVGEPPDLANLVDGDPVHRIDFRSVYASVLEGWLGLGAESTDAIVGAGHARLPLFA